MYCQDKSIIKNLKKCIDKTKKRCYTVVTIQNTANDVVRKRGDTMPEEAKQALENLSKNANSLTPEQLQRLGDIAYGMSLVKEAQPKKEA